jgi:ribonucleoside-triphosphate reductase
MGKIMKKLTVRKRNNEKVNFNKEKIKDAILKAGEATNEFGEEIAEKLTEEVLKFIITKPDFDIIMDIEHIQDIVETVLLKSPYNSTAKAYILYRNQHETIREIAIKKDLKNIDNYLTLDDWQVKENSNMTYSLQGLNNYIASGITKKYWLHKIYPKEIRNAHELGQIHIHDLGLLSVYCVGWDLQDILLQGFGGIKGKVEASPPKHFKSALGQIVNFLYTMQGEAAGAQAISNFDTLLAPFIAKDNLTYKEVKQNIQSFVFNMNISTRVGFQTPFTNLTIDLMVPTNLKDLPVIIGGEYMTETYSMYQKEMDILNAAFAEIMLEGDKKGRTFTFPIPTYNITKDFDWTNPVLDNIWKMTGKYGTPYFSNFVNSDLKPEDSRSMCCRLKIDNRKLSKKIGGLFGTAPLTGSIGVVTINLPLAGYCYADEDFFREDYPLIHYIHSKDTFFYNLGHLLEIAAKSLHIKRKVLENFTENNLYPYSKHYLKNTKERLKKYWANHFSTIGIIGMNELCLNLLDTDIGSPEGKNFAADVMDYILEKLEKLQKQYDCLFNLEATPAEGATYRLASFNKKCFPDLICANEEEYQKGAAPFYTNSTNLPVNYSDDIFTILKHQENLHEKYTGGSVCHLFLNSAIFDIETVKKIVKTVTNNFKIPYFTITPSFSVCPSHGYLNGALEKCPYCRAETEVYSRVVGYLRPVSQWNESKQNEFKMRKNYQLPIEGKEDAKNRHVC